MITQSDLFATSPSRPALSVAAPPSPRAPILSSWADITCGEACWHAREEVCRCSCGGRNHGCLRVEGAERPTRTAKIDGHRYELLAVGTRRELYAQAEELNGRQFRSIDRPTIVINSQGKQWTEAEIEDAQKSGKEVWFNQYYYTWSETDAGAPARLKYATADQRAKWPELSAYRDNRDACLLWQRVEMPTPPSIPRIARDGSPHPIQCPNNGRKPKPTADTY